MSGKKRCYRPVVSLVSQPDQSWDDVVKTQPEALLLPLLPGPDALSPGCRAKRAGGRMSRAGERESTTSLWLASIRVLMIREIQIPIQMVNCTYLCVCMCGHVTLHTYIHACMYLDMYWLSQHLQRQISNTHIYCPHHLLFLSKAAAVTKQTKNSRYIKIRHLACINSHWITVAHDGIFRTGLMIVRESILTVVSLKRGHILSHSTELRKTSQRQKF